MGFFTFEKRERITKRREFVNLNLHGKRCYARSFAVISKQNGRDITRLGISVGKKVGNSVKRNRIKRMIREFFRHSKGQIPKGYDIMIVALKKGDEFPFLKVQEELADLILKNDALFS